MRCSAVSDGAVECATAAGVTSASGRAVVTSATASPSVARCSEMAVPMRRGAVLDGERELVAVATQVQVRVAPGVKLAQAPEAASRSWAIVMSVR
jgi:hypothetical protein